MKLSLKLLAVATLVTGINYQAAAQDKVREITVLEDSSPNQMTTKVYELQHVKAADITPLIQTAVSFMDGESKVDRCNFKAEGKQLLVVSMWNEMIDHVDSVVKTLDRPGFQGRADYNFEYYMNYRDVSNLSSMLHGEDNMFNKQESTYYEDEGNVIRWRDSKSDGNGFLKIIKQLDKPVPQANLIFSVYEINHDDLKDIGVDYVSWMNGIAGSLQTFSHEAIQLTTSSHIKTNSTSNSNFSFDWSFVRLMQQKGIAKVATTGYATLRNRGESTITFAPNLQSMTKDEDQNESIIGEAQSFTLTVSDTLFFMNESTSAAGTLDFAWDMTIESPAGKLPNGTTIINSQSLHSVENMIAGSEKVITSFTREHDVTQYTGIPFLGELPVLKYIFGSETSSKAKTQIVVTVKAVPVNDHASSNTLELADQTIANAQIQ